MNCRSFVAIEVKHGCRILFALPSKVVRVARGGDNGVIEGNQPFDCIVEQQSAFGGYMMAAAGTAAKQLHQVKSLSIDLWVSIHAVIGHDDQSSSFSVRRLLNSGPNRADKSIDLFQNLELRTVIPVVMSHVIKIIQNQIEILNPGVFKLFEQLSNQLVHYHAPRLEPHRPLVKELPGRKLKAIL